MCDFFFFFFAHTLLSSAAVTPRLLHFCRMPSSSHATVLPRVFAGFSCPAAYLCGPGHCVAPAPACVTVCVSNHCYLICMELLCHCRFSSFRFIIWTFCQFPFQIPESFSFFFFSLALVTDSLKTPEKYKPVHFPL